MKLIDIQTAYVEKQVAIDVLEERKKQREAQAYRLQKRIDKKYEDAHWTENLIRPIMELVKQRFPQLTWKDDRLVPLGLRCAVSVFSEQEGVEKGSPWITFTPHSLNDGCIAFDSGKKDNSFQHGSIGYMNGFNNISTPLTNIEDLYDHIQRQLDKNQK